MRLYRAADDDYVDSGFSFSPDRETAEAYLKNSGYGGGVLYKTVVHPADAQILDLRGRSTRSLARQFDMEDPGAIGIEEWIPREPELQAAIRAAGYLWAIVDESYPDGSESWIWTGNVNDDEPVLKAVLS